MCNFTVLEDSLFENKANKIELSLAFFPRLQDNPPEFVKVTYNFGNDPQVWYWSAHTSHFLHPFEVFQYMSLLFSKPEPYFTGTLTLTLTPDCAGPGLLPNGKSRLQLLTQRLKLYAEKANSGITVSDTYSAKAYDGDTLKNLFDNDAKHTANIIICMAVFVILFSGIVLFIMICVFFCSKSHTKTKWADKVQNNQPAVLSFTCLSFILNIYILSLDITSAVFWNISNYNNNPLYSNMKFYNEGPIGILLAVDIIFIILLFAFVIMAICCKCNLCNCGDASTESRGASCKQCLKVFDLFEDKNTLLLLSLTVLCPIFCVIAHSPYIAIAYLNDGSHASSIFIYYTILCFIFFGVMWLFFKWCQNYSYKTTKTEESLLPSSAGGQSSNENDEDITEHCIYGCCKLCVENCTKKAKSDGTLRKGCCCTRELDVCTLCCTRVGCFLVPLGFAIFILLGLIATITCYFVLIPINRSISDAPNRLISIYESGGFLIGSFIVFKVIKYFYSKENELTLKDINNTLVKLKQAQQPNGAQPPTAVPGNGTQTPTAENGALLPLRIAGNEAQPLTAVTGNGTQTPTAGNGAQLPPRIAGNEAQPLTAVPRNGTQAPTAGNGAQLVAAGSE